jgi:hypothetical protein
MPNPISACTQRGSGDPSVLPLLSRETAGSQTTRHIFTEMEAVAQGGIWSVAAKGTPAFAKSGFHEFRKDRRRRLLAFFRFSETPPSNERPTAAITAVSATSAPPHSLHYGQSSWRGKRK